MIGLSLGLHDFGDYAGVGFQRPLALVGGVGLTLPRVNGHLEDALDVCDGILLGGGRDIDPARYGQEPTEHLAPTEPIRDAFELELTERVLDRGLPVLGMCRGIQILNVALGGTLVQDVTVKPEWAEHPSDRGWKAWKEVERSSLEGADEVPPHPRHLIAIEPGEPPARRARRRRDRGRQLPPPGARRGRPRPARRRHRSRRRRRGGRARRRPVRPRRPVGAAGGVAGRPPLPRALRPVRRGRLPAA